MSSICRALLVLSLLAGSTGCVPDLPVTWEAMKAQAMEDRQRPESASYLADLSGNLAVLQSTIGECVEAHDQFTPMEFVMVIGSSGLVSSTAVYPTSEFTTCVGQGMQGALMPEPPFEPYFFYSALQASVIQGESGSGSPTP